MQSNRTTLTITSAVVLIAAGAWFWTSVPANTAPVPPPVAAAQIAKPVEEPRELAAVAPKQDDSAMRDALLGLNKPQQEERPAPKRARRARPQIVEDLSPTTMEEEFPTELSDRAFQSAIGNWRGVKSCLVEQQAQNRDVEGSLRVSLVISGSGDVLEAKAFDESNASVKEISDCVERQARMLKFRPFSGEDVAKEAKFVF